VSAPEPPSPPDADALRRRVAELEEALARARSSGGETANPLERVTDAFVSLNDVWQFTFVNAKAAELFGRPAGELLGKHLWDSLPDGFGQQSRRAYYKALTEQRPATVEEYSPASGRWIEGRIYPSASGLSIFFTDVTERKRSEESRARLASVLEATDDLVAFADAAGTLLALNAAGRRMLALPQGAAPPGTLIQLLPPRLERRYVDEWLPAALAHGAWRGEAALPAFDGSERPVSISLLAQRRPDGSPGFLSVVARDLSPQRLLEGKVRESEERYRTILENAPEAVVIFDAGAHRFVDCNQVALQLFGLGRDEMMTLGPEDLSPLMQPDGRTSADAAREKLDQAIRGARPVFEWTHRTARGTEFPCEVRLVRLPGDAPVLIRGSIVDISERKRAEEALRESESRFRQIAETIHDVFWIGSPDLEEFLYVSPAFEEIWGRSRREVYRSASTWNEAIHPDDGGPALRAPSDAGVMDNTYRIIRPDGEIRWIRERGFPIVEPTGEARRMVGIAEDVTELKETEAELLESRRRLEEALLNTEDRVVQLEEQVRERARFGTIVGKSPAMQEVFRRLRLAGQSPVNVLITGESGTGKEMCARTIHDQGARKNRPFIAVNCSAIPEALLESELFGHVRGAFTGAIRDKTGLFESAQGGTLFLDEVGDMPPALQVKVLRALQEREIRRVGDEKPVKVDVHLITATNRNLRELLASGAMREDFYYRIRVFEIRLPPLRDRKDDVPLLVSHFVEEFAVAKRKKVRGIAADAMRFLMSYPWPGNIRELRNAVEHAFVTVAGDSIRLSDFPASLQSPAAGAPAAKAAGGEAEDEPDPERRRIEEALKKAGGHRGKAAKLLGCSRVTLWKRLRRLGL
jgi:PAS domain S-box-containing protein